MTGEAPVTIPLIDVDRPPVDAIDHACTTSGFLVPTGHGLDDELVACLPSCVDADRPCRDEPVTASGFLDGRIDGTIPTGDGTHG